jgi:hypothetical protein
VARIGIRWPLYRKAAPFTPTEAERRDLSEHLQYDIWMTFGLAAVMLNAPSTSPPNPVLDLLLSNALLESFLARARSVVEFLWHDRRKQEDALAADYFPPGEWKRMRPARPQRLDRLVTAKVGWGAMHLTYPRARTTGNPQAKQWEPIRMCAALEPTLRLFIDKVDASQFEPQWFDDIQRVLDRFKAQYGYVTP